MLRRTGSDDAKHIEEFSLTRSARSFLEDLLEGTAGDEQGTACAGSAAGLRRVILGSTTRLTM
jgi:hypothetical protein